MSVDSISIVEDFFQARLGTEVTTDDVLALPEEQLLALLDAVFQRTCTPSRGALVDPTPGPPPDSDDGWAAAFHTPSALFSGRRICEDARRLLPMVLYFDRVAMIDPLGAVAHYGQEDFWKGVEVVRMLLRKQPPNRRGFERFRRAQVRQALLVLEEINEVKESVRLVPAANWGTEAAFTAWNWSIQEWAYNRATDVDAGSSPRDDPRPDPDAALAQYLRAASVVSLMAGDARSWERAADDASRRRSVENPIRIAELLLARPADGSGVDLRRLLESDAALADVRSTLSSALEAAARFPSDDGTVRVLEAFDRSAERLRQQQKRTGPGTIELTASGLAIGGVVLDFVLTGTVSPSAVVDAFAAQLPLLHSIHTSRAAGGQDSVRGSLLRVAPQAQLAAGMPLPHSEAMVTSTTRALAGRVLADYVPMCARAGIWPPRAVYSSQIIVDVLVDWLWEEQEGGSKDAVTVVCHQALFDRAVAFLNGLHPVEPNGTWALLVVDCLQEIAKQSDVLQAEPITFRLARPTSARRA